MSTGHVGQEPPLGGDFPSSGPLLCCGKPSLPPGPVLLHRDPGPSTSPASCSQVHTVRLLPVSWKARRNRHVRVWQPRRRCERAPSRRAACRQHVPGIYGHTGRLPWLPAPQGRRGLEGGLINATSPHCVGLGWMESPPS